jgi:hypothetical protein
VIRTADAAKERSVASRTGIVDINELPSGVANDLNEPGRRMLVTRLPVPGITSGCKKRSCHDKAGEQRQA